jgi:septal ring factor EnvC (AmiA/AmiB activator)
MKLNTASAHPDIATQVMGIQSSLDTLQDSSSFSSVQADVNSLDADLKHVLNLLESARNKEYKYQADLEEIAFNAMSNWQKVRGDAMSQARQQAGLMRTNLAGVNRSVQQLNSVISSSNAASVVRNLEGQIRDSLGSVRNAEYGIEKIYSDIRSQVSRLNMSLTQIHWMLNEFSEASIEMDHNENLYMAVKARLDEGNKDDPEGILFLTNERLILEQKEKVATKKILFVTTASELVQQVLFAAKLDKVEEPKAQKKGLFGNQDFMVLDVDGSSKILHIDGQDSEDWIQMIRKAKSGEIASEISTGTGISFADLTGQVTEADILGVQAEVNQLQDEMMLKDLQVDISEVENDLFSLDRELTDLRARGYTIEKSLEADTKVLSVQWEKIKQRASKTIELQTKVLSEHMTNIQAEMSKLAGLSGNLNAARPVYIQLKSMIASAEAQADAAEDTVIDQYDDFADEVEALDAHLEWVDWMLDALEISSFKLLATESGVSAVEAVWDRPGLEPENGILFLTDQRFLWEDRVGDYELKLELPLAEVNEASEEVDEESEEEALLLKFGSSAPYPNGRFELAQPVAESWIQMINRAQSGGYIEDRAVEIDEKELDKIRNAPTQCSNCGAAFTAPILRGQTEIICEFCGVATRL